MKVLLQDWEGSQIIKGDRRKWMESWFAGAFYLSSFTCGGDPKGSPFSLVLHLCDKWEISSVFTGIHAVSDQPGTVDLKPGVLDGKIDQLALRII